MCNHCHSLVDFAVSGCGKTRSETMEEGFKYVPISRVMESGLSGSRLS